MAISIHAALSAVAGDHALQSKTLAQRLCFDPDCKDFFKQALSRALGLLPQEEVGDVEDSDRGIVGIDGIVGEPRLPTDAEADAVKKLLSCIAETVPKVWVNAMAITSLKRQGINFRDLNLGEIAQEFLEVQTTIATTELSSSDQIEKKKQEAPQLKKQLLSPELFLPGFTKVVKDIDEAQKTCLPDLLDLLDGNYRCASMKRLAKEIDSLIAGFLPNDEADEKKYDREDLMSYSQELQEKIEKIKKSEEAAKTIAGDRGEKIDRLYETGVQITLSMLQNIASWQGEGEEDLKRIQRFLKSLEAISTKKITTIQKMTQGDSEGGEKKQKVEAFCAFLKDLDNQFPVYALLDEAMSKDTQGDESALKYILRGLMLNRLITDDTTRSAEVFLKQWDLQKLSFGKKVMIEVLGRMRKEHAVPAEEALAEAAAYIIDQYTKELQDLQELSTFLAVFQKPDSLACVMDLAKRYSNEIVEDIVHVQGHREVISKTTEKNIRKKNSDIVTEYENARKILELKMEGGQLDRKQVFGLMKMLQNPAAFFPALRVIGSMLENNNLIRKPSPLEKTSRFLSRTLEQEQEQEVTIGDALNWFFIKDIIIGDSGDKGSVREEAYDQGNVAASDLDDALLYTLAADHALSLLNDDNMTVGFLDQKLNILKAFQKVYDSKEEKGSYLTFIDYEIKVLGSVKNLLSIKKSKRLDRLFLNRVSAFLGALRNDMEQQKDAIVAQRDEGQEDDVVEELKQWVKRSKEVFSGHKLAWHYQMLEAGTQEDGFWPCLGNMGEGASDYLDTWDSSISREVKKEELKGMFPGADVDAETMLGKLDDKIEKAKKLLEVAREDGSEDLFGRLVALVPVVVAPEDVPAFEQADPEVANEPVAEGGAGDDAQDGAGGDAEQVDPDGAVAQGGAGDIDIMYEKLLLVFLAKSFDPEKDGNDKEDKEILKQEVLRRWKSYVAIDYAKRAVSVYNDFQAKIIDYLSRLKVPDVDKKQVDRALKIRGFCLTILLNLAENLDKGIMSKETLDRRLSMFLDSEEYRSSDMSSLPDSLNIFLGNAERFENISAIEGQLAHKIASIFSETPEKQNVVIKNNLTLAALRKIVAAGGDLSYLEEKEVKRDCLKVFTGSLREVMRNKRVVRTGPEDYSIENEYKKEMKKVIKEFKESIGDSRSSEKKVARKLMRDYYIPLTGDHNVEKPSFEEMVWWVKWRLRVQTVTSFIVVCSPLYAVYYFWEDLWPHRFSGEKKTKNKKPIVWDNGVAPEVSIDPEEAVDVEIPEGKKNQSWPLLFLASLLLGGLLATVGFLYRKHRSLL